MSSAMMIDPEPNHGAIGHTPDGQEVYYCRKLSAWVYGIRPVYGPELRFKGLRLVYREPDENDKVVPLSVDEERDSDPMLKIILSPLQGFKRVALEGILRGKS